MHIKQIIIDGFKSYANRTVIDGWDRQFNAITGLNGSGKSNILDSICFVLGISNLSAVRAQDYKDLVYKQGQSRVTKASVTIVFDNRDRSSSPMGFEECEEITITRQIVLGGRNKYLINGSTAQQNRVQNLFHSVSLNVNNPHFLIMQGRITKVCNMKPHELLSLIEEATGTRMYESKKAAALATLEKKQGKMDEINRILTEELMATMEKLRDEKAKFLKWQTLSSKIERLSRFTTAANFVRLGRRAEELTRALTEAAEGIESCEVGSRRAKEELHKLKFLVSEEEKRRQEDRSVRVAEETVQEATKAVDTCEGAVRNAQEKLKKEQATQMRAATAMQRARSVVEKLSQRREEMTARLSAAEDAYLRGRDKVSALEASLVGVGGSAREGGGLSGQLIAVQQEQGEVEGQLQSERVKHNMLADDIAMDEGRLAQEEALFRRLQQESEAARARLEANEANVVQQAATLCESLGVHTGVQGPVAALRTARARLLQEEQQEEQRVRAARDEHERRNAQLAGKLSFHYQAGPGLTPESIKGVFAKLIEVKDASVAYALEVAAGGRLFQIVVDNSNTGKALLEQRRQRRESLITIIPLAQIRAKTVPPAVLMLAKDLAGDKADCAISLVNFDPSIRTAAEFVFGSTFICADNHTAEKVTFNRDIFTRSVTLQGDVFDPQGTLTGGSRPKNAGFLASVRELQEDEERLSRMQQHLAGLQARLHKVEDIEQQWQDLESQRAQLRNLDSRMEHSTYHRITAALAPKRAQLEALRAQIDATLARKGRLEARLQDLQRVSKSMEGGGKSAQKGLEAELRQAKSSIGALEQAYAQAKEDVERVELEGQSAREDADKLEQEHAAVAAAVSARGEEVEEAMRAVARAVEKLDQEKAVLAQAMEVNAGHNQRLSALLDERTQLNSSLLQYEADAKAFAASRKRLTEERAQVEREKTRLVKDNKWIVSEQSRFGERGGDYDFHKTDPRTAADELALAQQEEAELGRTINRKVQAMFEQAEKEYVDLLRKKETIERDKAKIEGVIAQLDAKKREALETAWREVTHSFDSIFSILLPGANARLKKHVNGQGVIVGLEMLVSFGGVEKESLSELSGGQRSLLALSLILALLRFKPAPMYILDEVDAALDLSHTQNIGAMLKKHFPQSQFIIVSLKEGMFNNANVLFRTKFVDGVSTVTCTRNNNVDE